eukprot:g8294.t1
MVAKQKSPAAAALSQVLSTPLLPVLCFYVARSWLAFSWLSSLATLIVAMQLCGAGAAMLGAKLEVGERAPAEVFDGLRFVQGAAVKPKPGVVTVLEFWATWCPPCKTAIPHLNELYRQHRGSGVQFVGVSAEAEGTVAPFIQQMGDNFTYPVALDPSRGCHDAFPSRGIPNAYVIGKDGCVAWTGHPMGDLDGAVRRALAQPAPGADGSGTGKGD